jgi:hypothetical protein
MDVIDTPSRSRLLWSEVKVDCDLGCGVRRDANLSLSGVCTVIFIGNAKNARFNPITVVPVLSTVPYWTALLRLPLVRTANERMERFLP